MIRFKKSISWIAIITFFMSIFAGTGALNPKTSFAYDLPPKDQGHTGPNPPDPKPKESPGFCPITGSPVHLAQGNFFYSNQDLFILAGGGFSLKILRKYHSQNAYEGPFGYGWSFDLLMELIILVEGNKTYATIRKGDGVRLKFEDNGDGTFTPPPGNHDTLVRNTDGSYDLFEGGSSCASCSDLARFDAAGRLLYKQDNNGNQMIFSYDDSGKVTSIMDPYGRQLIFTYGGNNKISQIIDPANRTFAYAYDAQGNLTGYTDPMGNTTTYHYDNEHNLTSIIDPLGKTFQSMTYDDRDRLASYSEGGETWSVTYYPDQNRTDEKDSSGNIWQYYYNDTGQMTQKKNPLGHTVTYTWDANLNWISERDARGYTTSYTYDANGKRLTERDPLGNIKTYTYDSATDKLATIIDSLGRVTKYEYDINGNQTKIIRDFGGVLQNETVFAYDITGQMIRSTDPLGNTTTYSYDGYGNLAQVTDAIGDTTSYTYDVLGNRLTETDGRGYLTSFSYDPLGRIVAITDALGNITTYTYDASGNLVAITGPDGNTSSFGYDAYNRIAQITDPLGNKTQYAYDARGNRTSVIDANGNFTTYTYNVIDQLTAETNALGHVTSYTYDNNGNPLTVTDANGNKTSNTYDALNRLSRTTYPGGSYETFLYDAVGNITRKTDRNGSAVVYVYDALNRLKAKNFPDNTSTTFAYDLNGNIIAAANTDVSYTFTYNALNWVSQVANITIDKTVAYSYECCGLKSTMTDSEGGLTNYTYDALKRLTTLTNAYGETTTYTYDNLSRVVGKTLANGSATSYDYDNGGRILSLVNETSAGETISSYSYTYGNTGNRTSMITTDGLHNYSYDKIYQVLQATHPQSSTESYSYDPVHNRLTSADYDNWTYDNNNRLLAYNGFSYTYDANGNTITKTDIASETTNYHYDPENRLRRIDNPDGSYSEYGYDPFGNRINKNVNGAVTWFVYDLMKMLPDLIVEYDDSGTLLSAYTHGDKIDDVISMRRIGSSYFYFKDALGTISYLNDHTENLVNTYKYDSFGIVVEKTEEVLNFYGYTGRVKDLESGLIYCRARYYDSSAGRFITADPIEFEGGINIYSYVKNNPINAKDPSGLKMCFSNAKYDSCMNPHIDSFYLRIAEIQDRFENRMKRAYTEWRHCIDDCKEKDRRINPDLVFCLAQCNATFKAHVIFAWEMYGVEFAGAISILDYWAAYCYLVSWEKCDEFCPI